MTVGQSDPRQAGRTTRRLAWTLLAVGLLAAFACVLGGIATVVTPIVHDVTGRIYSTPIDTSIVFKHHKYILFDRAPGPADTGYLIVPEQVRVVGPDGTAVPVAVYDGSQTLNRGGGTFYGAVQFSPPRGGRYQLQVTTTFPTQVMIARDIGATLRAGIWWLVGLFAAGGAFVAGVILLIVGISARDRAVRAAAAGNPPAPPAGWYGDPQDPRRPRFWDGQRWGPPVPPPSG